jgi:hypothetical protein
MWNAKSHGLIAGVVSAVTVVWPTIGAENGRSIPDFSGIWGHLSLPPFEPPLAGPGPVTNRSHLKSMNVVFGVATSNEPAGKRSRLVSDFTELVGDYTNPILKPEATEIVKQHGEISLKGVSYPTPSNQCWPGGVPYIFSNIGMQMLQQPDKITIPYSNDHEVRHVRMNAQHPPHVTPSWYGDSIGHYEGDTLVIDTVGIKVGPFAMIDF